MKIKRNKRNYEYYQKVKFRKPPLHEKQQDIADTICLILLLIAFVIFSVVFIGETFGSAGIASVDNEFWHSKEATEPDAEPVSQPGTEPETEPAEPSTQPETEPVSQPSTQPETEPVSQPSTQPETEPAANIPKTVPAPDGKNPGTIIPPESPDNIKSEDPKPGSVGKPGISDNPIPLGPFNPAEHPKTADTADIKALLAALVFGVVLLKQTVFRRK